MLCTKISSQRINLPVLDITVTDLHTNTPIYGVSSPADTKDDSIPTSTPIISPSPTPKLISTPKDNAMATITINTDRKTRTYDIMDNVDERTLKRNIGHLPSSVMPGEIGSCILMGHRDTDFSILQYVEVGDKLTVVMNGITYEYTTSEIRVVNSDSELWFEATCDSTLILVTCYPFRYTGHAPRKYIIMAKR